MSEAIKADALIGEMVGMRIDGERAAETFFGRFITNVISEPGPDHGKEIIERLTAAREAGQEVHIKLTVAGIEVNARSFIDSIEKELDRMVCAKAQDILKGKLGKISDMISNLERHVTSEIYDAFPQVRREWGE